MTIMELVKIEASTPPPSLNHTGLVGRGAAGGGEEGGGVGGWLVLEILSDQ